MFLGLFDWFFVGFLRISRSASFGVCGRNLLEKVDWLGVLGKSQVSLWGFVCLFLCFGCLFFFGWGACFERINPVVFLWI